MWSGKAGREKSLVRRGVALAGGCFVVLDVLMLVLTEGSLAAWLIILAVEGLALVLFGRWLGREMKGAMAPVAELERAAEQQKASALQSHDLHRLAKKLERVEEPTLAQRLNVIGSDEDMSVLLEALNDMMDRIDQRYQAQKRFTSDASHELRTPLSVIISYVDRLDRKGRNNPAVMDYCIDAIRESSELMRRLIEDLLLLARGDSKTQKLVLREVDLTELVGSIALQHGMVDHQHTVEADIQREVTATADTDLLRRCLWVLTENAQKYTPDGGKIKLSLTADDRYARITVADTGIGISAQDLPHVFERFYRADQSRARNSGGSGLGLSIARTIAGYHGGTLTVESTLGEGTAFTLSLPLVQETKT